MKKLIIVTLLFLSSCCDFRPHYDYGIVVPCSWREKTYNGYDYANTLWWQQFQDPVLDELIEMAIENNYDLGKAIGRVKEFFAKFGQEGTGLPRVEGIASVERIGSWEPYPGAPPISATQFKALIGVIYELDFWGRAKNVTLAKFEDYLSTVEAQKTVILTLVSNVAYAYIQLRALDQQLMIARKTWESSQKTLGINKIRHDEGLVSRLEVEQAKTEVETALTEVKKLEILIPQQENLISVLIGVSPTSILRGRPLEELVMPVCLPDVLPADLLLRRPDIMEAERKLAATEAQIGAARANFFPRISLTALLGSVSSIVNGQFTGAKNFAYDLNLGLRQTLFDDGKREYELMEAEAINEEALNEYKGRILTALREVNDALIAHEKSIELLEVASREVEEYQEYDRLIELQYEDGLTDYSNVLYAGNNLFAAKLRMTSRKADTFKTLIDLYKALGGGWLNDYTIVCDCR